MGDNQLEMPSAPIAAQRDSPEARRYNRIRRWLGVADFAVGLVFLIVLLATGWSESLRDLAYRMGFQIYSLSLFMPRDWPVPPGASLFRIFPVSGKWRCSSGG